MKLNRHQIEEQLQKEASLVDIPEVGSKAKEEFINSPASGERLPRLNSPKRGLVFFSTVGLAAAGLAAALILPSFLNSGSGLSYDDYQITDEDKQVSSQTLLYAVFLSSSAQQESSAAISSSHKLTVSSLINSFSTYLPCLEMTLFAQDFTCAKTSSSTSAFTISASGSLFGGEGLNKSIAYTVSQESDQTTFLGSLQAFSSSCSVSSVRKKSGDGYSYQTEASSDKHGKKHGHDTYAAASSYVLDTDSNGAVSFSLGQKKGQKAVKLSYYYDGEEVSFLFVQTGKGTAGVSVSAPEINLSSFTCSVDNLQGQSNYVLSGKG